MTTPDGGTPPAPTAAPAIVPPAAPAAPNTTAPETEPAWLAERLSRAETQLLKRLGVTNEGEIKAALEARRAAEESTKSIEQKRVEAESRAKKLEEAVAERDELVAKMATGRLASLTDAQRSAIEGVAGDDPILQLQLIESFAPTWAAATPASPATARPAHTAAPAPPPPAPGTPKTDFEKWTDLKATDPVGASLFYQMNSMRIEQSKRT
jgi:hypothetical protein